MAMRAHQIKWPARLSHLGAALLVCAGLWGCHPPPPPRIVGYTGPTEPITAVINQINQNADQIPTLRGAGSFEAWIVDDQKTHYVNGQATLLYARPQSMRLIGK